jgi:fumarylacetoacetate (FAA) hydrolase family protein
MHEYLTPAASLPADGMTGTLVGRAWVPGRVPGPSPVAIRHDAVYDLGRSAPTLSELLNAEDPLELARAPGERLGSLAAKLANSP